MPPQKHSLTTQVLDCNGIQLHVATQGTGPLVIMCHGMPGLWYSWRHQMAPIAEAGFTAVAFDQRGYGCSSRPSEVDSYDSHHTVADLAGLIEALGQPQAIVIGQDFGAAQVYNLAIRQPEKVRAVIGMACPYDFDFSGRGGAGSTPAADIQYRRPFARPDLSPNQCFAAIAEQQFFYAHYYQQIGPAERELGSNTRAFLTRLFWALSGRGKLLEWDHYPATVNGYLDVLAEPEIKLPWPWMGEADMDYYVEAFSRGDVGLEFIGGLNAYRVAERNWHINSDYTDARISQPSLFIAGIQDPVISMIGDEAFDVLRRKSDDLRGIELIDDAGHFVQQEQPKVCNRAIIDFLHSL